MAAIPSVLPGAREKNGWIELRNPPSGALVEISMGRVGSDSLHTPRRTSSSTAMDPRPATSSSKTSSMT